MTPFPPELRETIEARLRDARVPGAVIGRVSGKGLEQAEAFGLADITTQRAVDPEDVFHLYSGTKLFTGCAIMHLVEAGHLELDADVRELMPDHAFRHGITVEQLASHGSGLPETLRGFLAVHFPGEPRPSTADALARYRLDRGKTAGAEAAYRNVNYAVLGELVARVSGTSYEAAVREALLRPWGSRADFSATAERPSATGYTRRFGLMRLLARPVLGAHGAQAFGEPIGAHVALRPFDLDTAAAGGLVGSVADFAPMVAEFLSARDGVLRAETRQRMLQPITTGAAGVASTVGVGIGWKLGEVSGVRFWNHEGGGPGFCSELRIYPELGEGFVMLLNLSQSRRLSLLCHSLCEALRGQPPLAAAA